MEELAELNGFKLQPLEQEGREVLVYSLVGPDHKSLTTPTTLFDFTNPPEDPSQLALNLVASMQHHGGFGLSANQVGLPYRVFTMNAPTPFVCFNPYILDVSEETIKLDEGCLSFPGLVLNINRPRHIKVRFSTPSGAIVTKTFTGITARCFQHEMEHLDGNFFFDGVGRRRMEKSMKLAEKTGHNYSQYNLMKRAVHN